MNPAEQFQSFVLENIRHIGASPEFLAQSQAWQQASLQHGYAYNFSWMGRPVLQSPTDLYAVQELIWTCRPDLIIETGIAHGGSLITSASWLAMLDYCDAVAAGVSLEPHVSRRKVVGIDIDIRAHNRAALDAHPLRHKLHLIEGSSVSPDVAAQISALAEGYASVMVFLDSDHTHQHVLRELEVYAPFVTPGSYCVVWDTGIEDVPTHLLGDRAWGKGNNPKTAVWEYIKRLETEGRKGRDGASLQFEIDKIIEWRGVLTGAPDGFLRRLG